MGTGCRRPLKGLKAKQEVSPFGTVSNRNLGRTLTKQRVVY